MNFYSSYTGNRKRRIIRRVLAVVISVAVIFGGTVIFGNYLKKKAEDSGYHDFVGIGRDDIVGDNQSSTIIPPSEGGSGSSKTVQGSCVLLGTVEISATGDNETADLFSQVNDRISAVAENSTGILIPLTGDGGYLLYNSQRASEASRVPFNPTLPGMTGLSAAVAYAESKGLRTTAYIVSALDFSSESSKNDAAIASDSRIAADAAEAGFDEIVICSLVSSPDDMTEENSRTLLKYVNQVTAAAGKTEVGLAFPPEIYAESKLSPQIELFVSRSVFLALELSDSTSSVDNLNRICDELAGTLSVYNMRMMMSPADTQIANALIGKLTAVEHVNYLFTQVPVAVDAPPPEVTDPPVTDAPPPEVTDSPITDAPPPETEPPVTAGETEAPVPEESAPVDDIE